MIGLVALRKESVDRNVCREREHGGPGVALRKESVDRNFESLTYGRCVLVALRKESVDRNADRHRQLHQGYVALRKESVDRNVLTQNALAAYGRRSPQGERG